MEAASAQSAPLPSTPARPQAWVRQLRGEAPPRLSAFSLAVSFTLAGIQRFEQPVTGGPPILFQQHTVPPGCTNQSIEHVVLAPCAAAFALRLLRASACRAY